MLRPTSCGGLIKADDTDIDELMMMMMFYTNSSMRPQIFTYCCSRLTQLVNDKRQETRQSEWERISIGVKVTAQTGYTSVNICRYACTCAHGSPSCYVSLWVFSCKNCGAAMKTGVLPNFLNLHYAAMFVKILLQKFRELLLYCSRQKTMENSSSSRGSTKSTT